MASVWVWKSEEMEWVITCERDKWINKQRNGWMNEWKKKREKREKEVKKKWKRSETRKRRKKERKREKEKGIRETKEWLCHQQVQVHPETKGWMGGHKHARMCVHVHVCSVWEGCTRTLAYEDTSEWMALPCWQCPQAQRAARCTPRRTHPNASSSTGVAQSALHSDHNIMVKVRR